MSRVRVLTIIVAATILLASTFSMLTVTGEEYKLHDAICIYNDSMFDAEHGVTGGSGTRDNPYIIEGWRIDASENTGIYISRTSVYFIVRNCLIENGSRNEVNGVELESLRNGRVENCILRNNKLGIRVYNSSNVAIARCTVYNNSAVTLWLGLLEGGIEVDVSENITITDCKSYNNIGHGICLHSTSNATVENCKLYNNLHSGVRLEDGESTFLGIKLKFPPTEKSIIANCEAYNNTYGVSFLYSANNTVKDCKLHGNSYGIHLTLSSNNTVTGCTLRNNSIGIALDFSPGNLIYNNFFNNTRLLVYGNFTFMNRNWEVRGGERSKSMWSVEKHAGENIVRGEYVGGNYWDDYNGTDTDGDGIGDTNTPYGPGDYLPLIKAKTPGETQSPIWIAAYVIPIVFTVTAVAAYLLIRRRRGGG